MESRIYHLHALTALHAGTGQGSGVIDLPIAREKATGLPMVPGSTIKGVLRDELNPNTAAGATAAISEDEWLALFGPETANASDHAGALAANDARLLCLPARSLYGTMAWITSPLVLRRYRRDLEAAGAARIPVNIPVRQNDQQILLANKSVLAHQNKVILEDLDLNGAANHTDANAWAEFVAGQIFAGDADWQALFQARFAVVADAVFDFLSETATEIRTRIRMQEGTRTVAKGALWYEENLPAESILWGIVAADRSRRAKGRDESIKDKTGADLIRLLPSEKRLQVGGKATVGRGQVRWLLGAGG